MFEITKIKHGDNEYSVHEISVRARRDIFAAYKADGDLTTMSVSIVLAGCVELAESGSEAVLDLPGSVFDTLSDAITELSGMAGKKEGKGKKS